MKDPREKILEAFLDESLNDSRPTRSSAEILRNIQSVQDTLGYPLAESDSEGLVPRKDVYVDSPDSPAAVVSPASQAPFNWSPILAVAAVLLVAGSIGFVLIQKGKKTEQPVANNSRDDRDQPSINDRRPGENFAQNDPDEPDNVVPDELNPGHPNQPEQFSRRDDVPEDPERLVVPPEFTRRTLVSVQPESAAHTANTVDRLMRQGWEQQGVTTAAPLELRNWANRLSSRLIGRALTAEETANVNSLLDRARTTDQMRNDLIDLVLRSEDLRKEFSEYWGRTLAWNFLGISPGMQSADADMVRTREFLADAIQNKKPLDEVAYQMISAVGSTLPNSDNFNPAASYLPGLAKRLGSREGSVAHISRAFMGHNTQCAQCHDSFNSNSLASNTQREFYQFQAFFAQLDIQPLDPYGMHFEIVNRNYLPLGNQGKVEAAYKYMDLAGKEQQVFPKMGDLQPDTNGFVAKVDRRSELASAITSSADFRNAMIDQIWAGMLNLPLSGIDGEISEHNARIRQLLGDQFAANEFDLDWLIRTIASSEAFAVGVGTDEQLAELNPFSGHQPQFNVFYSRLENRRSAIQSLSIVANAYKSGDIEEALSVGLLARINNSSMSKKPNYIMPFVPTKNSQWATSNSISSQLELIAASEMPNEEKVKHLVLAALGRPAHRDEIQQASAILEKSDDHRIALQDVWWSLLNSVEYQIPLNVR